MSQQPGRSRGSPAGGRFAQQIRREADVDLMPQSRTISAWPEVGWEDQYWSAHTPGLVRRERAAVGRYRSAIPAAIAAADPALPASILADAEEAAAALAAFAASASPRSGAALAVLLRSESASSSQIEQITASARAVAEAEFTGQGSGNAGLVAANTHAMSAALATRPPITRETIAGIQATLMAGQTKLVGWREEPVWIGGEGSSPINADFVPPDSSRIAGSIDDLTDFIARDDLPVVVQTAIAHAQFETIHPFADGNGRTGRAIIHLMLRDKGLTPQTPVPVSAGLLIGKNEYFDALGRYRSGDAGPMVQVVARAALHAVDHGAQLDSAVGKVRARWAERVAARGDSGVWRVLDHFATHPVGDAESVAAAVGTDTRNVHRHLRALVDAGVLVGGQHYKSRRFLFRAPDILAVLDDYAASFGRRGRL